MVYQACFAPIFNPTVLSVRHVNPFKFNEVACGEDTDTSLFNITAPGWHLRSLAVSAGIFFTYM